MVARARMEDLVMSTRLTRTMLRVLVGVLVLVAFCGCNVTAALHVEKDWGQDLRTRSEIRWEKT